MSAFNKFPPTSDLSTTILLQKEGMEDDTMSVYNRDEAWFDGLEKNGVKLTQLTWRQAFELNPRNHRTVGSYIRSAYRELRENNIEIIFRHQINAINDVQ